MSQNYKRKDHLHQRAKSEGLRSRAAYKLRELDSKYGLFKRGGTVLDLGAWPGGWLQIAAEKVGATGSVLGVDLVALEDISLANVTTLVGNAGDDEIMAQIRCFAPGGFSVVLSDMSPKLTGIREADQAGVAHVVELAWFVAEQVLATGGHFVAKVFPGPETDGFVQNLRPAFTKVTRTELKSSRTTSKESYIIGLQRRPIGA